MTVSIQALLDPRCYPHPVTRVQLIETHISWLLLTGSYAYKIKKPVDLGFVDFSTLARRQHFCAEEVRLNRRFAPHIYIDVVPITGTRDHPRVAGEGIAIEYAVLMREFAQDDLLDRRLRAGIMTEAQIDALADTCAAFHASAAIAPAGSTDHGTPEELLRQALANFDAVETLIDGPTERARIRILRQWTLAEAARLRAALVERRNAGHIRECHGDLHLGNIALIDGRITMFDCIEFDAALRWIDVMDEIAFTMMDLAARTRTDYARRFVNRYLEVSGDYTGLRVLRFYLVYRAMVRAKVACIHAQQLGTDTQSQDFRERLALAERYAQPGRPFLAITRGLSGSGKTYASQIALERTGAIRLRSDVERKRLFGLHIDACSHSSLQRGIYDERANERTFERLAELARRIVEAGYPVIVDATFILHARRCAFAELAAALQVPFAILDCRADETVLEVRLVRRQRRRADASEAGVDVMRRQKQLAEALAADEQPATIAIVTDDEASLARAVERLAALGGTA